MNDGKEKTSSVVAAAARVPRSKLTARHSTRSTRPPSFPGWSPETELGSAGTIPFTRGNFPQGYRSRLWTMRQYAGYATARESNERYRYLLRQGQSGLSVAFDLPTQIGYDSDHPMAEGEVGRVVSPSTP